LPNYETPLEYFLMAITPSDAFFVRYHLPNKSRHRRAFAVITRPWRQTGRRPTLNVICSNRFLKNQFMFGSSLPFYPMEQIVEDFEALGLTPEALEKELWRKADRVLKLDLAEDN
jgi:predicted TIM-barrel fold metal-dependent hydrolase